MAEVTRQITVQKLSQRLNHDDWPHELKDLGMKAYLQITIQID